MHPRIVHAMINHGHTVFKDEPGNTSSRRTQLRKHRRPFRFWIEAFHASDIHTRGNRQIHVNVVSGSLGEDVPTKAGGIFQYPIQVQDIVWKFSSTGRTFDDNYTIVKYLYIMSTGGRRLSTGESTMSSPRRRTTHHEGAAFDQST